VATAAPQTRTRTLTRPEGDVEQPVPWNVVLLNDDHHTYEYVIRMMKELFAHSQERAQKIAETVDKEGRAVCLTTNKERAEFKRDQILAYGKDQFIEGCAGAMSAVIEPAEFGGEDEGRGAES
jgi:ATP-dependent Clp protease adaptor protein ClpS